MTDLEIIKAFCQEAQMKEVSKIEQGYNMALKAVVSLIETFAKIDNHTYIIPKGKGVK